MGKRRSARFKRAPLANAMRLTDRDREIIRLVHRHRFLRSSHIVALVSGSPQQMLRRLKLLYQNGYLERPRAQLEYFGEGGSRPIAYGLGKKGATLIQTESNRDSKRNSGDGDVGEIFLEHTLLVSDVMVAIELACRKRGDVRVVYEDQLDLPASHWQVKLCDGNSHGVVPDRIFAVESSGMVGNPRRIYYFLEADRGTMPVVRSNLTQTSFQRKLLTYEATWVQKVHQRKLGINRFRVLTVTTNDARVKHLIDACSRLKRGHGLFLFSDKSILKKDPLSFAWEGGKPIKISRILD